MRIVSVAGSDLVTDSSIQDVAEFAVKYHNKINFCELPLQLDGIDKAATELLDSGAKVYYLSLHIQPQPYNGGSPIPRPFTTAVACLPPLMKPNLCVGFVGFDAYMMQSSDDEDDHPSPQSSGESKREAETMEALKYQTETMEVAKLALKYQDSNECKHVEKVLSCSKSHGLADNNIYYHLTLQVRGIDSRSRLISTLATKFSSMWGDEIFESTPPITITHLPYPNWISYELLQRVRGFGIGVDHYLVFTKENQCGNPIIFFKNADSVRNLSKFATVLDPEQVRDELVPFLCEDNENVDPKLVSLIAKNLATLIPFVGAQHAYVLLQPLISLSRLGSHVIKSAVGSFEQIAAHTDKDVFAALFVPFVLELANSELLFHRRSSCGIFHIAFLTASEITQAELASAFYKLSQDSTPAVRNTLVSSLPKVAAAVSPSHVYYIQKIHTKLAHDEHWHVRLLAAEEFISLMKLFQDKTSFHDVILSFSKDPDPNVRALAPNLLYEFCVAQGLVSNKVVRIISSLKDLLLDTVTRVRESAARYVLKLWRLLGPELQVQQILSIIKMLSSDSSNYVRAVSAWLVMDVISAHGERLVQELRPILISIVKDEDICVRLNVIIRMDQVIQVIGMELRKLLMTTIDELTKDSSETAKLVIMVYTPMLASLFDGGIDKFTVLCQQNLVDEYPLVCFAAKKSLNILTEIKKEGSVWNATSSQVKEKFGSVKELCFPEDMQQLIKYIRR